MDNRTYRKGVMDIFQRLDHITAMASLDSLDIESVLIEKEQLDRRIAQIDADIKACTPTLADLNAAKNNDHVRLSTAQIDLNTTIDELKEIEADLENEKKEFLKLEGELSESLKVRTEISRQLEVFEKYKSNSREFKTFITENKNDIEAISHKIKDIKTKKDHVSNSIKILSERKDDKDSEVKRLTSEIEALEFNLSSDKNYKDSPLVQSKKRMIGPLEAEKKALEAEVESLVESPVYIAHLIKDNIDSKTNEEQTFELINKLCSIASNQPYMNITVREGATSLTDEYNKLKSQYDALRKRIAEADYTIKELPAEVVRISMIEKLINLNNLEIEQQKTAIKNNQAAISEIASTLNELTRDYKQSVEAVDNYEQKIAENTDNKSKAKQKRQLEMQRKIISIQEDIITGLKKNIESLIAKNNEKEQQIENLIAENKQYTKESAQILNIQMKRNNYKDVIKEGKDSKELEELETKIEYLERRLEYQNFSIIQLKNEVINAVKKIYGPKKSKSPEQEFELEKVKPSVITPLKDLLDNSKEDKKTELKESIASFEDTLAILESLNSNKPKASVDDQQAINDQMNQLVNDINTINDEETNSIEEEGPIVTIGDPIVIDQKSEESKQEIVEEDPMLKSIKDTLNSLNGVTPMVTPKEEKVKVISVDPIVAKTEKETPRIKVISVDPLNKELQEVANIVKVINIEPIVKELQSNIEPLDINAAEAELDDSILPFGQDGDALINMLSATPIR